MKTQDKSKIFSINEKLIFNKEYKEHFRIDPIKELAINLYFQPFLFFILECGGRCFQKQLIEYIQTIEDLKSSANTIVEYLNYFGLINTRKGWSSNILELTE